MEVHLDERIVRELKDLYKKQESEGKLSSRAQLEQYYKTFRDKFGPDTLKNLDGEALLETMHGTGNKESLAYWLEFKNDEEFPAVFGSIAGGTSFKFGLFRKKETGIWMTGSSLKPIELSLDQAIHKSRQHRDQLIAGAQLLAQMPTNGTDADYEQLQQEMKRVAPDVNDSSWGHKYFSLLFPDKLDDYHNLDYQRFHLIKLLQLPPQAEGRYVVAGRFIAIAHALDVSVNTLTSLLNARNGSPHRYWRIGTRGGINNQSYWEQMRDGNYCAIGWAESADLSAITNDEAGKQMLRTVLQKAYPDKLAAEIGKATKQIFDFRWSIAKGDLILASDGAKVLGIGRVTGTAGYEYDPSSGFPHRRPVEWLSLEEWQQPDFEGKLTTLHQMRKDVNLIQAEKRVLNWPPIIIKLPPLPYLTGIPGRIQSVLERKGQVILYGPPGTGKTYWAQRTAYELAARGSFNTTLEQLTPEQRSSILGTDQASSGKVRTCCFHPAYGYEDFLEGFRPEATNSHMQFVPRPGIFKQLCQDAMKAPKEKFYLIIDEINRGEIPRIFGELLTVLEKDKRGKSILLPLTGKPFQVPDNVYIIGTMNTADRSIALLDTALRRRFGFIELLPDTEPIKNTALAGIPLGPWLDSLNRRIREHVGHDARNLQIGHAYLLEKGQPIADFATFTQVLQDDILPLLEEYCYEDYTKLEKIMGSDLVDAREQKIRHELFDGSQQADLVRALLAPCDDITTSAQAIAAEVKTIEAQSDADNGDDTSGDQGA
jgi:5-methylcytosine-specific restriction protein B